LQQSENERAYRSFEAIRKGYEDEMTNYKANPRSKYRNKKVEYNGMTFDSKRELARYHSLELMEKGLVISNLQRQVPFELIPKCGKNRAVHYIADFVYTDESGNQVVEDAKAFRTRDYIIKKKLMLWRHGIEVKEI